MHTISSLGRLHDTGNRGWRYPAERILPLLLSKKKTLIIAWSSPIHDAIDRSLFEILIALPITRAAIRPKGAFRQDAARRRTKLIMHKYNLLAPFAFVFVGQKNVSEISEVAVFWILDDVI